MEILLTLRKPRRDGTTELAFTPSEPPKRELLPAQPHVPTVAERFAEEQARDPHSPRRLPWAALLMRTCAAAAAG